MSDATNARDEALTRVEEHADPDWMHFARLAVVCVAYNAETFTADDVWAQLDALRMERPRESRALAPVLIALKREGHIAPTDRFVNSNRVSRHAGPVRVWRSNLSGRGQLSFPLEGDING